MTMTMNKLGIRRLVLLIGFALCVTALPALGALPVEKLAPAVAFLREEGANGNRSGTGFFIRSGDKLYLITASHVSSILSLGSTVTIATAHGSPFSFPLKDLVPRTDKLAWVTHRDADVAILLLNPGLDFFNKYLRGHFMPSSWLERAKTGPLRALTLTVLGFPLQLGVSEYFSPISRETKAASGLLELPRFDTKVISTFFVTQDPSVGGFSGAPVFDTRLPYSTEKVGMSIEMGVEPRIVGLVHGTLSDNTGGKMGAIVPSFLILETLEQAGTTSLP
jgi:hypothetical protein